MRKLHITGRSWKIGSISLTIIALVLLQVSARGSSTGQDATSYSYARGPMTVSWGDPYLVPKGAAGQGWESIKIRGGAIQRAEMPGYYTYERMLLVGGLHAEWMSGSDRYVLDASFYLKTDKTPQMPTVIAPAADSFLVTGMDFNGSISANGDTRRAVGMAALVAAGPGVFGFNGEARCNSLVLYFSDLGAQFLFRWSESSQYIDGIQQPAADKFKQAVRIPGRN